MISFFRKIFNQNLITVDFAVANLSNIWEKITEELSKEAGLTQAGVDLSNNRLSYLLHPDFWTIEKLKDRIEKLGGKVTGIEKR